MNTRILERLAQTSYVRKAIEERADLSAFQERPSLRVLLGVFSIGFSYVIGWPAISALGALAIYVEKPLLVAIGGPLLYGLSHLVFMLGMYLSGAKYSKIFLRWATRVAMERLTGRNR
ncbi:MAG: hypothetical protein C4576_07590 [Desulfobacteraceae bacterium]|nr:MAG: hypothetical protein C4576_07590 [Desulfobacteraceae bacterium]